jgi:hypothetical protein
MPMDRVSPELGEVEVKDVAGQSHRLRELWASRVCVLVFVRQFG